MVFTEKNCVVFKMINQITYELYGETEIHSNGWSLRGE